MTGEHYILGIHLSIIFLSLTYFIYLLSEFMYQKFSKVIIKNYLKENNSAVFPMLIHNEVYRPITYRQVVFLDSIDRTLDNRQEENLIKSMSQSISKHIKITTKDTFQGRELRGEIILQERDYYDK